MPRVTSQKIRQALLSVGEPLDPNELPEKWELFDSEGTPVALGGGYGRSQITHSTEGSVISEETDLSTFDVHSGWRAFKASTNRPARVRVYVDAAHRDFEDEAERNIGTDPVGDHGLLFELITTVEQLSYFLSPTVELMSDDPESETFYLAVTNLDEVDGVVQTTFHYTRIE